ITPPDATQPSGSAPMSRPWLGWSTRRTGYTVAARSTSTDRVYSMVSPTATWAPLPGLDDLLMVTSGSASGCSVLQVSQAGGSSPPPVAVTKLPTEPTASASTAAVYSTA